VWKGGTEPIARHSISKRPTTVIGRHAEQAHIRTFHESISRQHAVIVFHKENQCFYLIDLKSFHGSFIDSKKVDPWVPIHVKEGAKITVGASTRVYVVKTSVEGQEKEEEQEKPEEKKEKSKKTKSETEHDEERPKKKAKIEPRNVQALHLLVKHSGSRNPTSWRDPSKKITRTKQEAIKMLREYLETIKSGKETIEELAEEYSDCISAKQGGDLGLFPKGKMQPSFEKAAFALDVGELSDVVESDSGVHIIYRKA